MYFQRSFSCLVGSEIQTNFNVYNIYIYIYAFLAESFDYYATVAVCFCGYTGSEHGMVWKQNEWPVIFIQGMNATVNGISSTSVLSARFERKAIVLWGR